jgi:hypothetical protein
VRPGRQTAGAAWRGQTGKQTAAARSGRLAGLGEAKRGTQGSAGKRGEAKQACRTG